MCPCRIFENFRKLIGQKNMVKLSGWQTALPLKKTRDSLKKWSLNLWRISSKTIIEVGNITKAATFKCFLHLRYKNTQLLFLWTVLFNILMRETITNDFGGLHKNMNCTFPLKATFQKSLKEHPSTAASEAAVQRCS